MSKIFWQVNHQRRLQRVLEHPPLLPLHRRCSGGCRREVSQPVAPQERHKLQRLHQAGHHQRQAVRLLAGSQSTTQGLAGLRRIPGTTSRFYQVWSLTQFYSVDFSKSRIGVHKCVFNKRIIKVCVSVLGPPRLAWHTWRCPCFSVVPKQRMRSGWGPLKGFLSWRRAL